MKRADSHLAMLPLMPVNIEKVTSEDGERFTTLTFGPPFKIPVTHSADRFFSDAVELPEMLTSLDVWLFIKPWLKNPPHEIERFWSKFIIPEAERGRVRATRGKSADTWGEERALIQMVGVARRLAIQPDKVVSSPHLFPFEYVLLCRLGQWVIRTIEEDREGARRLHQLLKDPTAADDKTNRDLTPRNVFNAFAMLVSKNQCLPTKKEVREHAFITADGDGPRVANRAFNKLGLGGLPEA